ncbi:MAG: glycolate oxidase subunit GlcE [Neisseria sp.]|nr:glycolate oxidase subunit GlcE [Neisseria sp.]
MEHELLNLQNQVQTAYAKGTPLRIQAGGTKQFYGEAVAPDAQLLDVSAHRGVVAYDPDELVLVVKAGTRLQEIEDLLATRQQILPFEPPHFGDSASIGGAVATALAGARRIHVGAPRDFVIGCQMIDGKGQILRFGGRVVKNVAGFDVHKLMTGSLGTLGVLSEIALKVLPAPFFTQTLCLSQTAAQARDTMTALMRQPLPLSGTFWHDNRLFLRLSGTEKGVAAAQAKIGGDVLANDEATRFWLDVREQRLPFFTLSPNERLWRISLPHGVPDLALNGEFCMEWGGLLRWYRSNLSAQEIRAQVHAVGGHATLFRGVPNAGESVFDALPLGNAAIQQRLKQLFDPKGIFNPNRLRFAADAVCNLEASCKRD